MASICNDEQGSFGVMSGHERNTLSFSYLGDVVVRQCKNAITVHRIGCIPVKLPNAGSMPT